MAIHKRFAGILWEKKKTTTANVIYIKTVRILRPYILAIMKVFESIFWYKLFGYQIVVLHVTALCQIADMYAFDAITSKDILRERIIFGIADNKLGKGYCVNSTLTLHKSLDICHALDMSRVQIKALNELHLTANKSSGNNSSNKLPSSNQLC